MNRVVLLALLLGGVELAACRRANREAAAPIASPAPQAASSAAPHGDHNPHHGGVVLMKGDLHFEVVFDAAGREYRLYFTDAVREDLPASIASAASLTIRRDGAAEEAIALDIDSAGESWIGSGRRVADPPGTTVRVAFTIAREPYWIDVPFAAR